jgi:hypothetical protein
MTQKKDSFMKRKYVFALSLIVLSTPFIILGIIGSMRIKPESHHPFTEIKENKKEEIFVQGIIVSQQEKNPSETFMNGYWDGWKGKIYSPFRWTVNADYRQGHMLGSYDRKNGIDRYERKK